MKALTRTLGLLLGAGLLALTSCRGGSSDTPPIHIVLDMDFQPKVKAQSKFEFEGFSDHRGMRVPVTGTVARGSLPNTAHAHRDASNAFVTTNPVAIDKDILERGREQYDIFCAICHGYTGRGGNGVHGNGMVGRRWPVVIPSFHFAEGKDNRVADLPVGELFEVISNGKGTMPAYASRITVEDRWAIIHYIRVLQSLSR